MSTPEEERLRAKIKTLEETHKLELLKLSRGRKVDLITELTMKRLVRERDFYETHCTRLANALREAAKFLPETKRADGWLALADAAPKRAPTPGRELLGFQPKPLQLTVDDLMRAVEDEKDPRALRIVFEQALQPDAPEVTP